MTRDQHLEFCKRCKNREFNPQLGLVCCLTKKIADFDGTCENFNVDESVKVEAPPAELIPGYQVVKDLSGDVKAKLRTQQDLSFAILGGLSAAIVSGLIWALITVSTKYQIGYMAIGVGLLVGFSVRYFGAGIDYTFGIVGAFFALLGCALGNLLSQVAFIADAESLGYFDVLTVLNFQLILSIFKETFAPMDVVFYGIAAYEGYKFAFRNIPQELINSVSVGKLDPLPYEKFRMPIVAILFVGLSIGGFLIHKGSVGTKVFHYESGAKRSEGVMEYGKENGAWKYWWENGKQQQTGFYKGGKQDSLWQFFDEDGVLYRSGIFYQNMQHGEWRDFYANGQIAGIGSFANGRQQGAWKFYYEDGALSQKGFYFQDVPDSTWELFYPDGKPSSKGSFNKNELKGLWSYWYEDGSKSQEIEYSTTSDFRILNSWNEKGVQLIKDGNGKYADYYLNGQASETGQITNGNRTGIWKKFTEQGSVREVGEYRNKLYYLTNSFSNTGASQVVKGEGIYESYYDTLGTIQETGKITGGLRTGKWEILNASDGKIFQEINYVQGQLTGKQTTYFETGEINIEGNLINNQRDGEWKWFYVGGQLETTVTFINGQKQGDQPFYDVAGNLLRTERYVNGVMKEVNVSDNDD